MPSLGDAVAARAVAYVGTPFVLQGRLPGVGLDCLGLVICAAREAGALPPEFDYTGYRTPPSPEAFLRALSARLTPIAPEEVRPGDVLFLKIAGLPTHLAIATPMGIVHSCLSLGLTVEHPFGVKWQRRLHSAYRF